jgi:hypothetical protein
MEKLHKKKFKKFKIFNLLNKHNSKNSKKLPQKLHPSNVPQPIKPNLKL